MELKLGKQSPVEDRRDLLFAAYRTKRFPKRPKEFGHELMIKEWGILANDRVGNCVFAGGGHEHMIWSAEGGNAIHFTDDGVISDYSAVTGYNPNDPSTDRGTLVREALKYRRGTGLMDARGIRHTIEAFVALTQGDSEDLLNALYLFGAVGVGVELPTSAMDQFNAGRTWTPVRGSRMDGGHYVPVVAYRRGLIYCVTWGRLQPMTIKFYRKYCDEAWAMLSPEMFKDGRTLEGFDLEGLRRDLQAL